MSVYSRSFSNQSLLVTTFFLIACASYCFLNSEKYIDWVDGPFQRPGFTRFEKKIVAANHDIMNGLNAISYDDSSKTAAESIAVARANRSFINPEMTKPSIDEKVFTYVDVGAKIPNYTPGRQWGTQGAPLTEMQIPLPAETSIKAYSVPQSHAERSGSEE